MRDEAADRGWIVGAVDGIIAAVEPDSGFTHGIARRAAGNCRRYAGPQGPGRPPIFFRDIGLAVPGHAGAANADRIADRLAVAQHIKKLPCAGRHHDGAGLITWNCTRSRAGADSGAASAAAAIKIANKRRIIIVPR